MNDADRLDRTTLTVIIVLLVVVVCGLGVGFVVQHRSQRAAHEAQRAALEAQLAAVERNRRAVEETQAAILQTQHELDAAYRQIIELSGGEAFRAAHASKADRAQDGVNPGLSDLAFLAGTWRGEMDGGFVEEIWSEPRGNAMMGMFRWLDADGQSRMYELLTITREGGETLLRLRHFTPQMIAWEEKETPVVLEMSELAPQRAVFTNVSKADRMQRIVFFRDQPDQLGIDVEFSEESERPSLHFRFTRARGQG